MPSNLTWWQAAKYAVNGVPVRRESVTDPLAWFVREVPGLFHRYEEENASLGSPAPADTTHRVVPAPKFLAAEFNAVDWTTFGIPAGTDVLPPAGRIPPGGGLPPGYPPIADPPPFTPPPLPALPHWETLVATLGSGFSFACSGVLADMPEDTGWVCFAEIPLIPPVLLGIGGGYGVGDASCAGTATLAEDVAGLPCTFRAVCVQGTGRVLGSVVLGTRTIAVV